MTDSWFSAAQLAGLPGLPTTVQRVNSKAIREGWQSRPRKARGGGLEYSLTSLPTEAQAALVAIRSKEAASAGQLEARKLKLKEDLQVAANDSQRGRFAMAQGWQGKFIDARLAILAAFRAFSADLAAAIQIEAAVLFCRSYNEGRIEVGDNVRCIYPSLSHETVARWEREVKAKGLAGIATRYGNRAGSGAIASNPELHDFVVALLTEKPHTSAQNLLTAIMARFENQTVHLRTLQRFLTNWKANNKALFLSVTNPDAWKSKTMAAFGDSSADVTRPNQRWEMDSTPTDVMLKDGRHTILGLVDVATRRARLLVSKTSKATAVTTLMRHTMLEWGVPESIKTDNGSDYVSKYVTRVVADLGIEHETCAPFSPWMKPHIERFFNTFSHGLLEMLDGFIGHNVAERKAIEARKTFAERLFKDDVTPTLGLTAEEMQRFCDQWVANIYDRTPHKGLNGKTPAEAYAAAEGFRPRLIEDERALDILLAEPAGSGGATVQKKGLRHDNAWFISPELALYIGERVHVRLDPVDLGRVYVFNGDGAFLTVAENPARTGMDRKEVAAHAKEKQKAQLKADRAALRATARRVDTDGLVDEILASRAIDAGKLTYLPKPVESHDTPALAASRAALEAEAKARALPPRAAIETDLEARAKAAVVEMETPERRFVRWARLDERVRAGESLIEKDRLFHREYESTSECRAQKRLAEMFGTPGSAAGAA